MSTAKLSDVLAHIDAALHALTYEDHVRINCETGEEEPVNPVESSIGQDLHAISERIVGKDPNTGQPGRSLLSMIGAGIDEAVVELVAARNALKGIKA